MRTTQAAPPVQAQRGAATLVIVMVLFLVMALLAAYANRSLMFEQRISGSYYRASVAQEMSEGGLDLAVALLNGTALDDSCKPVASGGTRFVDRYLTVSATDRSTQAINSDPAGDAVADCARTDDAQNELVCRCLSATAAHVAQPSTAVTDKFVPSLGIKMGIVSPNPYFGSFMIGSVGCTDSSVDNCKGTQSLSQKTIAVSNQQAALAFVPGVPSVPASPLIVKGSLTTSGGGGLGLHNSDPQSTGVLVMSGGAEPTLNEDRMDSVPGTPSAVARVFRDSTLNDATYTDDKMLQTFLGMMPSRYRNHPALRLPTTCTTACVASDLVTAYNAGMRIIWIEGNLTIGNNINLGTANAPVLIFVNGNATITGPMQLTGILVVKGDLTWSNTGGLTSLITGSVLVTGAMSATGSMDIYYQQALANQLRNRLGSYARVPGGWIDADSNSN